VAQPYQIYITDVLRAEH